MKTEKMKCVIPFSDGGESYKKDDVVIVLPELEKENKYAVATDYCKVVFVEKSYLR